MTCVVIPKYICGLEVHYINDKFGSITIGNGRLRVADVSSAYFSETNIVQENFGVSGRGVQCYRLWHYSHIIECHILCSCPFLRVAQFYHPCILSEGIRIKTRAKVIKIARQISVAKNAMLL